MYTWFKLKFVFFLGYPIFGRFSKFVPRFVLPPITLNKLPKIDVVLISHNHKDHLDEKSLYRLKNDDPLFLIPIGNGRWFSRRGFKNILEMNWWEKEDFGVGKESDGMTFSFLPATHWTGRTLFDLNKSLWGSWMIEYKGFKIYFAGDTAYSEHFKSIREYYSPIHVALMPIGPEEPRLLVDDAHTNSQQAIQAFLDLNAENFIPMHWGTFSFGLDDFSDPIEKLRRLWDSSLDQLAKKNLHVVKFGEPKKFSL